MRKINKLGRRAAALVLAVGLTLSTAAPVLAADADEVQTPAAQTEQQETDTEADEADVDTEADEAAALPELSEDREVAEEDEAVALPELSEDREVAEGDEAAADEAALLKGHKHKWKKEKTVAPTCTEQGYTLYKCEYNLFGIGCTATKKDDYVPALGHDMSDWIVVEATCTTAGEKYQACKRSGCNHKVVEEGYAEAHPALGHDFEGAEWVVEAPTCTTPGKRYQVCKRDGCNAENVDETYAKEHPALGHAWGKYVDDDKPGCQQQTETAHCTREGCTATDTEDRANFGPGGNPLPHKYTTYKGLDEILGVPTKYKSTCDYGCGTTKEFGESTVSKILDLVENSSMKKARAENFITRFARVYTPAVCYGALALAFLPPVVLLLMGQPARFGDWVYRALTFLVISCPCALVISIPLSFFGGIGGASACGILVKGSTYLEELARTGIVVFDKTGTLTQGTFKVVDIHPENGVTGDALVEAAALAESWSKHPISLSIKNAYGKDIDPSRVTDVQELGGHGVTAKVDGKTVAAGNARLMAKLGLTVPEITEPGTIVHVAMEGRYAGYLLIADVVKPHSAAAIKGLKQAGVRKTVMLTGDAEPVAKAVSAELGLDEYHAGLLPGDKVDQIETLLAAKQPKENLAFVGDGINDAPVLSRADVGIAMGALGSDAAIEAADVVLMDDDPAKIALAMRIARRTLRIVYQNIVFALAIKFACLVLGALGLASMWTAIFADVGVMVLAVLNATRALYTKDLAKKNVQ